MMDSQKLLAQIVGVVLTLVGVIGFFVSGKLLVFGVNNLHNIIHLVSGILGLVAGFYVMGKWAPMYNKVFGVVYLLVGILGIVAASAMMQLLAVNMADNVLHLLLGVVLAGVGFGVKPMPVM